MNKKELFTFPVRKIKLGIQIEFIIAVEAENQQNAVENVKYLLNGDDAVIIEIEKEMSCDNKKEDMLKYVSKEHLIKLIEKIPEFKTEEKN